MTVDDFAAFLAARYDEAEANVSYAGPARVAWLTLRRPDGQLDYTTVAAGCNDEFDEPWCADGREIDDPASVRIIYDPARRLADIKLKRAILAGHPRVETMFAECGTCHESEEGWAGTVPVQWPCATVRQLGTEFAEHELYKQEWRPE